MIVLSDNDVILKLAVCDCLDDAVAALGCSIGDVFVLPTARPVLAPLAESYGEVVVSRLNEFLVRVRTVDWELPIDELQVFEDTFGIDPGEAVLFSASATLSDFLVVTGDKASLTALAAAAGCEAVVRRLTHRVLCFEQVISRCIKHFGFDHVKQKFARGRHCDMVLRAVFGSGLAATEESVADGLDSYIRDLRSRSGDLLID